MIDFLKAMTGLVICASDLLQWSAKTVASLFVFIICGTMLLLMMYGESPIPGIRNLALNIERLANSADKPMRIDVTDTARGGQDNLKDARANKPLPRLSNSDIEWTKSKDLGWMVKGRCSGLWDIRTDDTYYKVTLEEDGNNHLGSFTEINKKTEKVRFGRWTLGNRVIFFEYDKKEKGLTNDKTFTVEVIGRSANNRETLTGYDDALKTTVTWIRLKYN